MNWCFRAILGNLHLTTFVQVMQEDRVSEDVTIQQINSKYEKHWYGTASGIFSSQSEASLLWAIREHFTVRMSIVSTKACHFMARSKTRTLICVFSSGYSVGSFIPALVVSPHFHNTPSHPIQTRDYNRPVWRRTPCWERSKKTLTAAHCNPQNMSFLSEAIEEKTKKTQRPLCSAAWSLSFYYLLSVVLTLNNIQKGLFFSHQIFITVEHVCVFSFISKYINTIICKRECCQCYPCSRKKKKIINY